LIKNTFCLQAKFKKGHMKNEINQLKTKLRRCSDASKTDCGRILIVAGSAELSVAAYLNVLAALRSGAGWVVLATPRRAAKAIRTKHLPIKIIELPETSDGQISHESLQILTPLINKFNTIMIGAGLGLAEETENFVVDFFKMADGKNPTVRWVVDTACFKPLFQKLNSLNLSWKNQIWLPNDWELRLMFGSKTPDDRDQQADIIRKVVDKFEMT
jgi:NAD(P)H-hydrate repair Nnr-like enzyme with NAD(P)H-hydrate dehydratase domain